VVEWRPTPAEVSVPNLFSPRLDILPPPQRRIWNELTEVRQRSFDAMLSDGRVDLPSALASAGAIYGAQFNPQVTLKALSYFDDGDLPQLPHELRGRLVRAVAAVDLDHLPAVTTSRDDGT
jgi:hypothetical protein